MDENGNTILSISAQVGSLETLKFLIEQGAEVNTTNDLGNTPLHYSIGYGYN